jgi:hypothetical protein
MTDQPRQPDLDAAIDATVRSLTAVSDDAAADSLRRTRTALAERRDERTGPAWRWGFGAAAAAVVLALAAILLWPRPSTRPPDVAAAPPRTPASTAAPSTPVATAAPATPDAPRTPVSAAARRPQRVRATSIPAQAETPAPDPLIGLVRAVQGIPDDAWRASLARAAAPVATSEVTVTSIDVAPIPTPPLGDLPIDSLAPGEP